MITMTAKYLGNLRNEATHLKSGNTIITDAPIDNNGKGEAFSPTDLLCTSLATCMMTLMGITANEKNILLEQVDASIEKVMYAGPRRVGEIHIQFSLKGTELSEKDRKILENAANTCPVAKSIHPDIILNTKFEWI